MKLHFWTSRFLPPPEVLLFRDVFVLSLILFVAAFPLARKKKKKKTWWRIGHKKFLHRTIPSSVWLTD